MCLSLYKALGIPEWSEREKQFFIANGILPADANDDTVMPWSPGAAYTRFVPHDANKEWVGKMDEQGLVKDSGPSGTTDEILQAGDYTSITSQDAYGACVLRDTASAGMHLQLHHSWAEVAQGATASDRATPAFSWEGRFLFSSVCSAFVMSCADWAPALFALVTGQTRTLPGATARWTACC